MSTHALRLTMRAFSNVRTVSIRHADADGRVRVADGRQSGWNRGQAAFCERAAEKRGKSTLPRCVGCLLAIGWGQKRIARNTGWAKTSIHRWAKFNGLNLSATAEQKKQAACRAGLNRVLRPEGHMLRAFNAECGILRSQEANHWPRRTIVKRGVLTIGTQMDLYYANHDKSKEQGRSKAIKRYRKERDAIAAGAKASTYWVARRVRSRISAVVRRSLAKKNVKSEELCGCSWAYLLKHIEARFCARMSWANYGRAWHIDHIIPCAAFDLRDEYQQRLCFHYSNLRPMWAKANRKKSDRVIDGQFNLLLNAT